MPLIDRDRPGRAGRAASASALGIVVMLLSACGGGGEGPSHTTPALSSREAPANVQGAPVYRFAKISTGAYFYTGSQWEADNIRDNLPDFRYEGIAFYQSDAASGTPVYRFANLDNGGYFYTASAWERDNTIANYPNMRYEGSTFSVAPAGDPAAAPVYRVANLQNGAYLYTTNPGERDAAVALGFWRDEGSTFAALTSGSSTPSPRLYFGIAVEDRFNNPEDPTIGTVFLRLPPGDGAFAGQMPFTFIGCTEGADVGSASGERAGNALNGQWAGTMDGVAVGGSFSATLDLPSGSFIGTVTNGAGKQPIQVGACNYHVAASMALQLHDRPVNQPATFQITVTDGPAPRLSWPPAAAGQLVYALRLFDETCLLASIQDTSCFLGEAYTSGQQLLFVMNVGTTPGLPAQLPGGRSYLAILTAQQTDTGELRGLAMQRLAR